MTLSNAFIDAVYARLSPIYDVLFGRVLQAGRLAAVARMGSRMGTRVLEVGIGTGINASLYPREFHITGIDLSQRMLEKARDRITRDGLHHIRLQEMDAAHLTIADD